MKRDVQYGWSGRYEGRDEGRVFTAPDWISLGFILMLATALFQERQ